MALESFEYTKTWESADDFPTVETSEAQVRADIQCLYDEIAAGLNALIAALNAGGIDTAQLKDGAVTTGKIDDGAVTHAKLADDAVEANNIKDGEVTTAKIHDGDVTHAKLATDAVEEANIKDGEVTKAKLSSGVQGSLDLADSAYQKPAGGIPTDDIADGAIKSDKIYAGAVTGQKLSNGAVDETQLAAYAVTTGKLRDLAVTTGKIANKNVTTQKIADGAVTADQLASSVKDALLPTSYTAFGKSLFLDINEDPVWLYPFLAFRCTAIGDATALPSYPTFDESLVGSVTPDYCAEANMSSEFSGYQQIGDLVFVDGDCWQIVGNWRGCYFVEKVVAGSSGGGDDVFVAEYGVTEYNDIAAAYAAGKRLYCKASSSDFSLAGDSHYVFPLTRYDEEAGPFYFALSLIYPAIISVGNTYDAPMVWEVFVTIESDPLTQEQETAWDFNRVTPLGPQISGLPEPLGTAAIGTSKQFSRKDHVHPLPLKSTTLTLATTDWSSQSCSKTVTGMTATAVVWLEYSDPTTEFTCVQSANTLTFTCDVVPSADVSVKVAFMEVAS